MKKLLSILTTFTAVSIVAPTIVAYSSGDVVENILKEITKNRLIIEYAKAYYTAPSDTTKGIIELTIKGKFESEIKYKLKGKPEADAVIKIIKEKFTIKIEKGTDVVKITVTPVKWDDKFATDESKKADQKATYELITGEEHTDEIAIRKT